MLTFFLTPELRADAARVEFLPLCYQDVLVELRRRRPAAALFMCSPPDADGNCSFGTEVAFVAELWRDIPVRIAHLNPSMPRTSGDPGIPFDALTAYVEADQPLLGMPVALPDDVARRSPAMSHPMSATGRRCRWAWARSPMPCSVRSGVGPG